MIDIIEVARAFMSLNSTRIEGRYTSRCPFHNDKTPSFFLFRESERFYCFGCKEKGDTLTLLQKLNNWTWKKARNYLAELYPESFNEDILSLLQEAASVYKSGLDDSPNIKKIISNLGFTEDMQIRFNLGFADHNTNSLLLRKFKVGSIQDAGLMAPEATNIFFRQRLMIPLTDSHQRVVGFQGRELSPSGQSKYLTIYNSKLFNRSSYLYGEEHLLGEEDEVVLVEGIKDVYSLTRWGIPAISALGTNLGPEQKEKLEKFLKKGGSLVILFDGDEAGQISAEALAKNLSDPFYRLNIAILPEGLDPSESMEHEVEQAIYQSKKYIPSKKMFWKFHSRGEYKPQFNLVLPVHLSRYLKEKNGVTPLKIPSSQELQAARIHVVSLRLADWLDKDKHRLSIQCCIQIKEFLFRYKLLLSTQKWKWTL